LVALATLKKQRRFDVDFWSLKQQSKEQRHLDLTFGRFSDGKKSDVDFW